ncbi:MAG: hypothetical protein BJ554DRAFT_3687 [Olpidium bornovanus]|uniref:Uncharacterized protein n=1 Tax=Olpidium bornovanus TaxID=278681 RepID=A0A8H8DFR9_9FUNG|nr:MAG: hypothetical protein BJ554DRAFT_3687 [Olpidium bornovanus]
MKAQPEGYSGKPLPVEEANSAAFAAIVGAIYHENGAAAAKDFLMKCLFKTYPRPAKQHPDLSAADASAP